MQLGADFAADLQPRLLGHARSQLIRLGLDPCQDEDLVQEAWARWLKTQPARVEQWLRVVIHGIAVDQVRRRQGDEPLPLDTIRYL